MLDTLAVKVSDTFSSRAAAAALVCALAAASGRAAEPSGETMKTVESLLVPFWKSATMDREGLFFARRQAGEPAAATLLFPPEKVLALRSATGEVVYEEGRDYAVDRAAGVIRLVPGSRISAKAPGELYPPADSRLPKMAHRRGDPRTCLLFSEGDFFHRLQAEVTYTHAPDLWKGPVPKFAGAALPGTMKKLRARESLVLCLSGDSISQGYNASGLTKAPPQMPAYGELVALGLEKAYGSKITFRNFAVAGWSSDQGLADARRVAAAKPDLVIIAYGMNDTGKPAAKFATNVRGIIEEVRKGSPAAEFILVAPMLGNAEWHALRMERFPAFRDALGALAAAEQGAALADLTSLWAELLKRKSFLDLTGNGVNHPNDFGHRLYAQVLLAMLVEK